MTHTHKYKLVNLAARGRPPYPVYKCDLCPHYVALHLTLGRASICWSCGKEFQITQKQITRKIVKPKCPSGCMMTHAPLPEDFGQ